VETAKDAERQSVRRCLNRQVAQLLNMVPRCDLVRYPNRYHKTSWSHCGWAVGDIGDCPSCSWFCQSECFDKIGESLRPSASRVNVDQLLLQDFQRTRKTILRGAPIPGTEYERVTEEVSLGPGDLPQVVERRFRDNYFYLK